MRNATVLLIALCTAAPALAADRVERPVSASADAAAVRNIVIEIPSSALLITTHREPVVRVEGIATRTYRGEYNRAEAESLLGQARVDLTLRGRTLYVSRQFDGRAGRFWNSPEATNFDLDLHLPAGIPVEIRQNAGTLEMEGSFGDLDVKLGAGDVMLRMPRTVLGELDAATTVGDLKTDLGPRIVEKSGVMAGSTVFVNDQGTSKVRLRVRAGTIDVRLTD